MPATPSCANLTWKTIYGETTLQEALLEEHNMLHELKYWQKREDLLRYLEDHTNDIEATVSHLLALDKTKQCRVEPVDLWRHGSFNMCISIHVTDRRGQQRERFIIRFPLPYKIGEETFPGNADEKLRCEAATYIWIGQNCPDVPIPRLLGFSFDGMQYVSIRLGSLILYSPRTYSLSHLTKPHGILGGRNTFGGIFDPFSGMLLCPRISAVETRLG